MEETVNTGVIYMITNTIDGKMYIGRAKSYQFHGSDKPPTKHGAKGRFKSHLSKIKSGKIEIPLLYNDIIKYGKDNFKVQTLEVCLLENIKEREEFHIKDKESYKKEIGYNMFIGDKKPIDPDHKKYYENKKSDSNKNRATDGALRRTDGGTGLPPNVYRRKHGLFAQIKLPNSNGGTSLYNKAFFITNDSEETKLQKALAWLEQTKAQHQQLNVVINV
jgi:hypothetical protein